MFNIFLILFAFVIQQTAYLLGDWALVDPDAGGGVWIVPGLSLLVMIVFGLVGRIFVHALRARFARHPHMRDRYYLLSRKFAFVEKILLLTGYLAILVVCNWRSFAMRYADVFFVETLVELAPFFILLVISWINHHALDGIFTTRRWTRRQYVDFQFRQISIIVVAMLAFSLVYEIIAGLPAVNTFLTLYPEAMMLSFIPLMLIVYTLIPILARFVWKVESLPAGPLRDRLEAIGRRNGVKVRDILLWHTSGGWVVNAAAIGIFPRLRYVVLTDGLVRSLTPEEIEAVYGHELGHAHYAHIAYYAAFLIAMSFLTMYIMGMQFLQVHSEIVQVILQFVISFGLFIGVVFGFVSRRFEREADLFGSRVVGDPLVFVEALEKVSTHGGGLRKMRSWSHSSIEKRVGFLAEAMAQPEKARRFERTSRNVRMIILLVAFACVAYSASRFVAIPRSERVMEHVKYYRQLIAEAESLDEKLQLYAYVGDMALKEGYDSTAQDCLNAFYSRTDAAVELLRRANPDESDAKMAEEIVDEATGYIDRGWIGLGKNALRCAREFATDDKTIAGIVSDLREAAAARHEAGQYLQAVALLDGTSYFVSQSSQIAFEKGLVHYDWARELKDSTSEPNRKFAQRKVTPESALKQAIVAFNWALAGGETRAALYLGRCHFTAGNWEQCLASYRGYPGELGEEDTANLQKARLELATVLATSGSFQLAVINYVRLGQNERHKTVFIPPFCCGRGLA